VQSNKIWTRFEGFKFLAAWRKNLFGRLTFIFCFAAGVRRNGGDCVKKMISLLLALLVLAAPALAASELPVDGRYTVEVTLSGGSGRASVETPAKLTVEQGAASAVVVWSSSNYEFMVVDGQTYRPIQEEGNSTFEIPVVLDEEMAVSAQTLAMSEPHLIDYTLLFRSDTLKPMDGRQTVPVWGVLAGAAVLAVVLLLLWRGRRTRRGGKSQ